MDLAGRDNEARSRITALNDLRETWRQLLPMVTLETWYWTAGLEGPAVGELLASLVADLELLPSPLNGLHKDTVPPFAHEFIQRRLARKLSQQYSPTEIGTELERRYDRASRAPRDGPGEPGSPMDEVLQRMRRRLDLLAAALRC